MRATDLIEKLQDMIKEQGDCYVVFSDSSVLEGLSSAEKLDVIPYHETKYFRIE